jgi:filamentous hemagglutinin family protein
MRSTRAKNSRIARLLTLAAAAAVPSLLAMPAMGAARGHKDAAPGGVSIVQRGNVTIIHAANDSIIDFADFNIALGDKVRIIEPSAQSRVLEEVTGTSPTIIDGSLHDNGQLILTNPNGIKFGSTANVQVGGLTAVAGTISHADFLSGNNHFTNLAGPLTNLGQLVATNGNIVLAGATVSNNSTIAAGKGTVVMAAGSDVYVGQSGSGIFAKVSPTSAVTSTGGSGDIYSLALGAASRVNAQQVVADSAGSTSVSGAVAATSAATVTGNTVALSGASIAAPTVNVGGGAHGQDSTIQNASQTTADSSTVINGNTVVVWSDQSTAFHGTVNAPGGWVETSSAGVLDVSGSSINADGGTWLMDPTNVEITTGTNSGSQFTGTNPITYSPTGVSSPSQIAASTINQALNGGDNVVITTASSGTDAGTITQDAGANISNTAGGARSLTLEAAGGVTLNGTIIASGTGNSLNVTMEGEGGVGATGAVAINNNISTGGGAISITASSITQPTGVTVSSGAGNINLTTDTLSLGDAASITGTGLATIQPLSANPVQLGGSSTPNTLVISQADLSAFASGFLQGIAVVGANGITVDSGGITINNPLSTTGSTLAVNGAITTAGGAAEAISFGFGPTMTEVDLNADVSTGGGSFTVGATTVTEANGATVNAGSGTVSINADNLTLGGSFTGNGEVNLALIGDTAFQLGGSTAPVGTLLITQQDLDAFQPGFIGVTIQAGNNDVTVDSGGIGLANNLSIVGTGETIDIDGTIAAEGINPENFTVGGLVPPASVINIDAGISLNGGNVDLSAADIEENGAGSITLGAGTLTLQTDILNLAGTVTGSTGSQVIIAPVNDTAIQLGGSSAPGGTMLVTAADLAAIGSGISNIVVEPNGSTLNTVTIDPSGISTNDPLTINTSTGGSIDLNGNVTTVGGQTYNSPVLLGGDASLSDTGDGDITFNSTVDGAFSLTIGTGGTTVFNAVVGGTASLSNLTLNSTLTLDSATTLNAGSVSINGAVITATPESLTVTGSSSGTVTIGADVSTDGGSLSVSAGTIDQSSGALISVDAGNVTFTTDNLNLNGGNGSITGTGTATIAPLTDTSVEIGSDTDPGGTLVVTQTDINAFSAGFGTFEIEGGAGAIDLEGDVSTPGQDQMYNGNVILSADSTLSGASITFTGTIDSETGNNFSLGVEATGAVSFGGNIGKTTPLSSLTVSAVDGISLTASTETFDTTGAMLFESPINGTTTSLIVAAGTTTTFDGDVAVLSLTTQDTTGVIINGNVTTTGGQVYNDAVTLGGVTQSLSNSVLNGIQFLSTVDGDSNLTVFSSATGSQVIFAGAVGSITPLNALTVDGAGGNVFKSTVVATSLTANTATTLSGNVTTTAGQTYDGPVVLTLNSNPTLEDTGTGSITFDSTVNGTSSLTTITTGANTVVTFVGAVGGSGGGILDLTVDGAGGNEFESSVTATTLTAQTTTTLDGNVTTNDGQTYDSTLTLDDASAQTLSDGAFITFDGNATATPATAVLTVNAPLINLSGVFSTNVTISPGATNQIVDVHTTGSINQGVDMLPITGGILNVDPGTGLGQPYIDAADVGGITIGKTITLNSTNSSIPIRANSWVVTAPITIDGSFRAVTGAFTFDQAVTLAGDTTISTNTPATGTIRFGATVDGSFSLAVNSTDTAAGAVTFGGNVGGITPLTSLSVDGPMLISGNVTTTGPQTYSSAVALNGVSQTFKATGTAGMIAFASTIDSQTAGGSSLTLESDIGVTIGGAVGSNESLDAFTSEGASSASLGGLTVSGGAVTTTGNQTYDNPVTITANTTFSGGSTGAIDFDNTVTGNFNLTAISNISTTFTDGGTFASVLSEGSTATTSGTTNLSGTITTTAAGGQVFDNAVVVDGNSTLNAGTGTVFFASTINGGAAGAQSLTVQSDTSATFTGAIGQTFALGGLISEGSSATGNGTTAINGGSVTTTGNAGQTYGNALTVGQSTTFSAGSAGAVTFNSSISPTATTGLSLTVISDQTITFDGPVGFGIGSGSQFASLTTEGSTTTTTGQTVINTSEIVTSGASGQVYDNAVIVGGNSSLQAEGSGVVTFESTVDGDNVAGDAQKLTIISGGAITFNAAVGATHPLSSLTAEGIAGGSAGTVVINGPSIATNGTGGQSYQVPVTLGTASTTMSAGAGSVTFASTLNAAGTAVAAGLTISSSSAITFMGLVGATEPLQTLTTNSGGTAAAAGTTVFDFSSAKTADITTTGAQTFNQQVILLRSANIKASGTGGITFGATNSTLLSSPSGTYTPLAIYGPKFDLTVNGQLNLTGSGDVVEDTQLLTLNGTIVPTSPIPTLVLIGDAISNTANPVYKGAVEATTAVDADLFPTMGFIDPGQIRFKKTNGIEFATIPPVSGVPTELATVFTFPYQTEVPPPIYPTTELNPAQASDLEALGIYVKPEDVISDERVGESDQGIVIVDWPGVPFAQSEDFKITPSRFEASQLSFIVTEARQVWPAFPNQREAADLIADGLARYRATVNPPDQKVPASKFAEFVMTHQDTPNGIRLAVKLQDMRKLADDIGALGLTPAEGRGSNQAWATSTPEDPNLVNDAGESDPYWLYDVIESVPPRK